jgi:hypothetical protein
MNIEKTQLQFEISKLLYLANSRFGMNDIEPSLETQKEIYSKIAELRKQLREVKISPKEK